MIFRSARISNCKCLNATRAIEGAIEATFSEQPESRSSITQEA